MMKRMAFKPKDIKSNCEKEGKVHKVRIVFFSILMASVATVYQSYFDNLAWRSSYFQQEALAGKRKFLPYYNKDDPSPGATSMWDLKNRLDVIEEKSLKDLKYIEMGWKSTSYTEKNVLQTELASNGDQVYEDEIRYAGPNGNPYEAPLYFTQKQRYDAYQAWDDADEEAQKDAKILTYDQERYSQWETMHDGVIWFDTAGCISKDDGWIGYVNKVTFGDSDVGVGQKVGFWTDTENIPQNLQYDADQNLIVNADSGLSTLRSDAWDTTINSLGAGHINWADENLYRDLLKDFIEMREDCDIDCQARGSNLTLIATLMGMAYGIVCLNALFMFIGTWHYRWRICSIYCTFATCLIMVAVIITVGVLLFTKYNKICGRSMVDTYQPFLWTMADDFHVTGVCWITSMFAINSFVCCGLVQAYNPVSKAL